MGEYEKITAAQAALPSPKVSSHEAEDPKDEGRLWSTVGQPYAIEALKMGVSIQAKGYNLLVTGPPGVGKYSAVKTIIRDLNRQTGPLQDILYTHSFDALSSPLVLYLPQGKGPAFKESLYLLIKRIETIVGSQLKTESFKKNLLSLISGNEKATSRTCSHFEKTLQENGFTMVPPEGEDRNAVKDIVPLHEGIPTSFEALKTLVASGDLTENALHEKLDLYLHLLDKGNDISMSLHEEQLSLDKKINRLRVEAVQNSLRSEIAKVKEQWSCLSPSSYWDSLEKDLLANLSLFWKEPCSPDRTEKDNLSLKRYDMHLLVENGHSSSVPLIANDCPSLNNLFGSVQGHTDSSSKTPPSPLRLQVGSLVRANGGYLILWGQDLLENEDIWIKLRQFLNTGKVELSSQSAPLGSTSSGLSCFIEVKVKVVLLGPPDLYDLLCEKVSDCQSLFKVLAEFRSSMPKDTSSLIEYRRFIRQCIAGNRLKEISSSGLSVLYWYGTHLAEERDKLSTRFALISDLIREADYWATREGKDIIDEEIVHLAIEKKKRMMNLSQEIINERIKKGSIMLKTTGHTAGCVNGLAVMEKGSHAFGTPIQITVRVSAGQGGIINIEREAGLSGEFHDKGILILEGYLRSRYARLNPLSLTATICVEQSYWEIEGDSAASSELYALLSAIGEVPLRQDIAVTGAVSQMGEIQPVGGISEKIEGFFDVCQEVGTLGSQGVLIPRRNQQNLVLSEKILIAMRAGRFHIYIASTVDEAMELLTGLPAGEPSKRGVFPKGSCNYKICENLRSFSSKHS